MGNTRYLESELYLPHWNTHELMNRVIDGAESTLDQMERVPVNPKNRTLEEIKMTHVNHTHENRANGRLQYMPILLQTARDRSSWANVSLRHCMFLPLYVYINVLYCTHYTILQSITRDIHLSSF